ncbi:hypothetical protein SEA_DALANDE_84 [Gordonia phage DalanDe]|nr:hypothetical protein SEA_DALANDE_84 [Gordonia phage DalanDe]
MPTKHYASRLVRLLMPGDVVVDSEHTYTIASVVHTEHTTTIGYTDGNVDIYSKHEREGRVRVDEPAAVRRAKPRRTLTRKKRGIAPQNGTQSHLRVVG